MRKPQGPTTIPPRPAADPRPAATPPRPADPNRRPGTPASELKAQKLIHLFTTPILKHIWADSGPLNDDLRRIIINKTRGGKGASYSAIGGWESSDDFHQWAGEQGQKIIQRVAEMVKHATAEIYATFSGQERSTWTIAMWANVNRRGNYNRLHVQPGSTWSGTYIVDTGLDDKNDTTSGVIGLINPNLAQAMSFYRNAIPMRYIVRPEPGLMMVWPSYIAQMVYPHGGKRPRVSISFNVKKDPYP